MSGVPVPPSSGSIQPLVTPAWGSPGCSRGLCAFRRGCWKVPTSLPGSGLRRRSLAEQGGAGAGELVSEGPGGALGAQGWWQRGFSPPEMYSSSSLRCGERGSERREQQH